MQTSLQAMDDFKTVSRIGDVTKLLLEVRKISNQVSSDMDVHDAYLEGIQCFSNYAQPDGTDIATYLRHFKHYVESAEQISSGLFEASGLVAYEMECDKKENKPVLTAQEYQKKVHNCLMGVDHRVYGPLMNDISDQYLFRNNVYPNNVQEAYTVLRNHSSAKKRQRRNPMGRDHDREQRAGGTITGMQYIQQTHVVPGTDGRSFPTSICRKCQQHGHFSRNCPGIPPKDGVLPGVQQHAQSTIVSDDSNVAKDTEATDTEDELMVSFQGLARNFVLSECDDRSILIDSGSTCSVFRNANLLIDIESSKTLRAFINGGHQDSNQVALLPDFFKVWYNPDSLMNILALSDVRKHFRVTMDTNLDSAIHVHMDDGRVLPFKEVDSGLYLLESNLNKENVYAYTGLNLVEQNKAQKAREFYRSVGMPGYDTFARLLEQNYYRDCPVTASDVCKALQIYGPEVATL